MFYHMRITLRHGRIHYLVCCPECGVPCECQAPPYGEGHVIKPNSEEEVCCDCECGECFDGSLSDRQYAALLKVQEAKKSGATEHTEWICGVSE